MNNVDTNGQLVLDECTRVPADKATIARYKLEPCDVVFNNTNSADLVGKAALFTGFAEPVVFSNHFTRLRTSKALMPSFLSWWLLYQWRSKAFVSLCNRWVNQSAVKSDRLLSLAISIPSRSEQRRIVEILDQADAIRKKRAEADKLAERILPALFYDMFGDPATNPKGWPVASVGDIAWVKGGKRLPKGSDYSPSPTGFRYIRGTDIEPNRIHTNELRHLYPHVQKRIARYIVAEGDVVITIAGKIGVAAPVTRALVGVNLTENAARLTPKGKRSFDASYLSALLNLPWLQAQIEGATGRVTIGKLALFRIERMQIPLPAMDLQCRFSLHMHNLEEEQKVREASDRTTNLLTASLLHRAFSGELTAKWREKNNALVAKEMAEQKKILNMTKEG